VHNAIPTAAVARGTLRVLDRAVWAEAQKLVERILEATVAPYPQVTYRLDYQRGAPPVVNDEEATAVFATAARSAIGDEAVLNAPQSMGGEDFSWYLEEIPGSMARLGVRIPGTDLDIHAASFDVDERCIAVGVRILVETAMQALDHYGAAQQPGGSRLRAVPPGRVGVGR
jgi:metal-dependent amidase/aminoacylase/carboxypeptidase family protein